MKTILVPVDLSAASARVCAAAGDFARLTGSSVVLLHVIPPVPVSINEYYAFDTGHMAQALAAVEGNATRKLAALAKRHGKRGVVFAPVTLNGDPAKTILAEAKKRQADCIVIGAYGHGAMYDLLIGSTTQQVLRKSRCPVLVVPVAGS